MFGASDKSASFLQAVAGLVQLPSNRVAKAMCGRTVFVFEWQRWSIHLGANLWEELVSVLAREDSSVQDWMSTPPVGERPFPITCNGSMRKCAASGRTT